MIVLVTGDRNWTNQATIARAIVSLPTKPTLIVEGGQRGADLLACAVAKAMQIPVAQVDADWQTHHRAAGPIRNRKMLDTYHPDLVLAFHDSIETSKGTKDCVAQATKRGIPVTLITTGDRL